MRDLDETERGKITEACCPVCEGRGFRIGPQGGMALNIECASLMCKARFNVVMFGGRCLMAQTIESEADGGSKWPTAPDELRRGHKGTFS